MRKLLSFVVILVIVIGVVVDDAVVIGESTPSRQTTLPCSQRNTVVVYTAQT